MGINMNDAFPSKWLKAGDVDRDTVVTMRDVTMEEIGDDDRKPVLWLEGYSKGIVLNKTNASNISALYGANTDGWIGRKMLLSTTYVDFNGKSTLSLRLYPPRPGDLNPGGFVSGLPDHGDPRGDFPPAMSADDYGARRG